MNNIERKLKDEGVAIAVTKGDSMEPMLKSGDIVIVQKPSFPLNVFDIPVYRREGHLTMHRIVKIINGKYVICADNRTKLERDITEKDIVGVLAGYYKNGEYISLHNNEYIEYCKSLNKNYSARVLTDFCARIKSKLKNLLKGGCGNEIE